MKRCTLYSRVKIVKVNHLPWNDPTKGFLVANLCGRRTSMDFLIDTNRVMVDVVSRRVYDNYDVQFMFTAIDMQVNVTHVESVLSFKTFQNIGVTYTTMICG